MIDDLVNQLRHIRRDGTWDTLRPSSVHPVCARAADRIEALTAEVERLREALTDIGVYGCGMLNQPAAMNGPEEAWLRLRIREMENVARAALGNTQ